jgi:tetratricopeptide (TPR) repeat protein
LEGLNKFFPPDSEESAEDLITFLATHYDKVSERFGYEVLPPEATVNSLGYNFMQSKPEFAYALFDLNLRNYPQSANVFDSMGDYYLAQSDTLKAIEHFNKAFDMGESPFTKEKLDALEKPE